MNTNALLRFIVSKLEEQSRVLPGTAKLIGDLQKSLADPSLRGALTWLLAGYGKRYVVGKVTTNEPALRQALALLPIAENKRDALFNQWAVELAQPGDSSPEERLVSSIVAAVDRLEKMPQSEQFQTLVGEFRPDSPLDYRAQKVYESLTRLNDLGLITTDSAGAERLALKYADLGSNATPGLLATDLIKVLGQAGRLSREVTAHDRTLLSDAHANQPSQHFPGQQYAAIVPG